MTSPFPGMDPYIESAGLWPDFHVTFIGACRELLLKRLPREYDARIEERTTLLDLTIEDPIRPKAAVPDIAIERDPDRRGSHVPGGGRSATLEPTTLAVPELIEVQERFIEIRRAANRELVTVIEVLSPSNKANPDFGEHQKKRTSLVYSGVNFVEIDLLTRGLRTPTNAPPPAGDYFVFLFRPGRRDVVDAFHWFVRDSLPQVPIPLREQDGELSLDLAAAFATAYDRGDYWRTINYRAAPDVRLSQADLDWAAERGGRFVEPAID